MERSGLAGRARYVGSRFARLEDDRLLSGGASFVADLSLPGAVELAIVRSPFPHARIRAIRLDAARAVKGVVAVISGDELEGISPFPDFFDYARAVRMLPLCWERVRYVGAPIVAVVAEDRYLAEDAAELVELDLDELPAVATIEAALAEDAPRLFDDWPDKRIVDAPIVNPEVEAIFARSRVLAETYRVQRHTAMPIETRGSVAEYRDGRLTLSTATQNPHIARTTLSYVLPWPSETYG